MTACIEYRVDSDGKPIAGSAHNTTMKASSAAASILACIQESRYGVIAAIEKEFLENSERVELFKGLKVGR